MKVHVVYDSQGKIVAAAEAHGGLKKGPVPRAGTGQTHAELDVPVHLEKKSLQDLVKHATIDTQSKKFK
jgi:hypothetical protein